MSVQATLKPLSTAAPAASPRNSEAGGGYSRTAIGAVVIFFICAAWTVYTTTPYSSSSRLGYALGITGGLLMLTLLLYPLRKRTPFMQNWGPLKYWFRLHMIGGVLGPVLVLFHSTFRVGSPNAAIALGSMLLVVGSGLAGRFLYRQIHHGLYGSQATLQELRDTLGHSFSALSQQIDAMPDVRAEVECFMTLSALKHEGVVKRALHFLLLGWHRRRAHERARRGVMKLVMAGAFQSIEMRLRLRELLKGIDLTLRAAQRTAQFSTYERLFALWHVVHIPFLVMLVLTAIVHVVAVHVY